MSTRFLGISFLPALTLLIGLVLVEGAATQTPVESVFRDDPSDRIRSDGEGPYEDGPCTASRTESRGSYFLRTIRFGCPDDRFITLDFSTPVSNAPPECEVFDPEANESLNICGPNGVTDVRIIANTLFKDTALSTGTTVSLHFSQKNGGDFTGPAPFELSFEDPLEVTGSSTFRVLTATSGVNATAELYQNKPQGKRTVKVSLGRYEMPFELTVTKE